MTVITTSLPAGKSVLPEIVGVVSLVSVCGSMFTIGGVVSSTVVAVAVELLPFSSVTVTSISYSPSSEPGGNATLKLPFSSVVPVIVWLLPSLSVITTTTSELGASDEPPMPSLPLVGEPVSITTLGPWVLITASMEVEAVLPATSDTVAVTVKSPFASACGTSALKLPSSCTVAVRVCVVPSECTISSVTIAPGSASVSPFITGVSSLVEPIGSRLIIGAVVSISPVTVVVELLPAGVVTVTSTVYSPSLSSAGTSSLNVPSAPTVVTIVCSLPSLSVTTMTTSLPGGASVSPETFGVVSFVGAG